VNCFTCREKKATTACAVVFRDEKKTPYVKRFDGPLCHDCALTETEQWVAENTTMDSDILLTPLPDYYTYFDCGVFKEYDGSSGWEHDDTE
jgi:hypothetical protein